MKNKLIWLLTEFVLFGLKNARACIFAGAFLLVLIISNYIPLGALPRYDFIFLAAILIQIVLIWTKLETVDEAKTIFLFHIIGFALEAFKTHPAIGSWAYPEFGYFKILDVPLYSGFMYAAVGSYISQAWKIFDIKLRNYPKYIVTIPLVVLIYVNFFTHHFIGDFRWYLKILVVIVFFKTFDEFKIREKVYRLPLLISFFLIAFFIWIAENISTFYGAWQYPNQVNGWDLVAFHKVSSWSLLVIISFIIVANLKHFKAGKSEKTD